MCLLFGKSLKVLAHEQPLHVPDMGEARRLLHDLPELDGLEIAEVEILEVVEVEPDTVVAAVEVAAHLRQPRRVRERQVLEDHQDYGLVDFQPGLVTWVQKVVLVQLGDVLE